MSGHESDEFSRMTAGISEEVTAGAREKHLAEFMPILPKMPEDLVSDGLPKGHIALVGDFVQKPIEQ